MTKQDIITALSERMHIERLRPMQTELLDTDASSVALAAPTGSGKTIAFTAYLLRRTGKPEGAVQGVVMVPSRELALQVRDVVRTLASGLKVVALYGGHSMDDEKKSLTPSPDIIVATPGRLLDHLQRKQLSLEAVKVVVLDEYDKCLELGFEDDMRRIRRFIPHLRDIVLTSATPMAEIPEWLGAGTPEVHDHSTSHAAAALQIVGIESPSRDKAAVLIDLLHAIHAGKTIVFVNHRESADRLCGILRKAGIDAALYHGGLDQHGRETAVAMLANGTAPVLVATDLASRGLDITGVDAVVHYHIPPTPESWTHRNGRTARNGADGTVYVITSEADSMPDFITISRPWTPPAHDEDAVVRGNMATLHFNAGRKEKVSRGDIAGFLIARGGLDPAEVGRIVVADHEAIAAVPRSKARAVIEAVAPYKLKNKKVRVTRMKL
ncbi:MAG: DEAD/DEAH box helicase [Bacteroides sp.]|nr:DEAD/DEAH box helicase [Bacteroides sp.]